MRYGVIADVHGNVHALEAVLDALGPVDRLLCAGDIVGYGPKPNECVERIVDLGAITIAGNHDLLALGRLPVPRGRLQRKTTEWTRTVLSPGTRSFLAGLPLRATGPDGIEIAHGSVDDPSEYIYDCNAARAQLARVPDARALVVGHTHLPLECDGRFFNPGSVGQSREANPHARAMVLDVSESTTADFLAVDYDVDATRRELRSAGLPPSACHLPPGRLARLRRLLPT